VESTGGRSAGNKLLAMGGSRGSSVIPHQDSSIVSQPLHLSDVEKKRLQRILAIRDLESQKRIAYPFWGLAGVIFLASQAALLWNPILCIALVPTAFAALMIGIARFGYYRLFRLIHYQNAVIENSENTSSQEG